MRWFCIKCRKYEDCACAVAPKFERIKELFDTYPAFARPQFIFPIEHLEKRKSGSMHSAYMINYHFGQEKGIDYLEFYADWKIATPDLMRISADGTIKSAQFDDTESVYDEAKKLGLLYNT